MGTVLLCVTFSVHGTVRWVEILCGLLCSVSNFFLLFHVLLSLTTILVLYIERRYFHLLVFVNMSEHMPFWDLSSQILLPVFFNNDGSDVTVAKRVHTLHINVFFIQKQNLYKLCLTVRLLQDELTALCALSCNCWHCYDYVSTYTSVHIPYN
jgi:hypothetical protein